MSPFTPLVDFVDSNREVSWDLLETMEYTDLHIFFAHQGLITSPRLLIANYFEWRQAEGVYL